MTRQLIIKGHGTPFGQWIRDKCRKSTNETRNGRPGTLCVTNLDYVFESYRPIVKLKCIKGLILVEEKSKPVPIEHGQRKTFQLLDRILRDHASDYGYVYWGFFLLQFSGLEMKPDNDPCMKLNGHEITEQQLIDHLDFYFQFCPGYFNE